MWLDTQQSKVGRPALGPFEVIDQRPVEVTANVDTPPDCPVYSSNVVNEIAGANAIVVIKDAVFGNVKGNTQPAQAC